MPVEIPRTEKRIPTKVAVQLSSVDQPAIEDMAFTEDVSSHGARVATKTRWRPQDRVLVKSIRGSLRSRARVVYCQPLESNSSVIGLELFPPLGDWVNPDGR